MRVAIYARVSTTDQNCEMQLRELREYVTRRGWEIAGEYVDTGWSGAKASRPRLDKLMEDARTRTFDVAVCWKLDRWGRSLAHTCTSIGELKALGIRWIAVTQNIDTDQSNPMSHLLLHIMAAFAEFERELIRERVGAGVRIYQRQQRAGQAASKSGRNLPVGRPRRIFNRAKAQELRESGWESGKLQKLSGLERARWNVPSSSLLLLLSRGLPPRSLRVDVPAGIAPVSTHRTTRNLPSSQAGRSRLMRAPAVAGAGPDYMPRCAYGTGGNRLERSQLAEELAAEVDGAARHQRGS